MPPSSLLSDPYCLSYLSWDDIEALMLWRPEQQRRQFVSSRGGLPNIEAMPDQAFRRQFRFEKADFPLLISALQLPQHFTSAQGVRISAYEALCMCLRRLAYPNRLCDLQEYFARHYTVISSITNKAMHHIESKFGFLLDDLTVHKWLDAEGLAAMSEAVYLKGAPLENCWAFIDGTVRPICRPSETQRMYFSGHKRVHALKYQSLMCPNGLICELDGPYPGSKHDAGIMGRLVKQRNGGAKLAPVQETAVQFYLSCTNWTLRNAVGLEPLRDVLSNLSVRYWPLLDVYGEEYNAPRILLRLLLRLRLDVFVSLRVQRSLRNRSHYVLNIDSPRFGLPEGLLRFDYPDKGVVLDHYHDFIVLVARFFRTDVRLSTVAREIVEFEENLAMTVEAVYSEKSFLWSGVVTENSALNDTVMTPFTEIINKVTERLSGTNRSAPEVVLWSKEYLQYLSHLFHQPVIRRHLINYMTWRVILELGPYTSQLFLDIRQEFLRRIGLASNAARSEHCLHDLLNTLPHTAGWLLLNETASLRNSQKQVERMCEELKATMAHNLDYNEWMTPATRQHAISKTEYQDTYVILVVKLMVSEAEREWQKLTWNRPEFSNDVPYSSLEVHYDPIYNTVVVPGAMLEPPLYTEGLSPALNFGSLGFLIASKMMSSLIFEGRCFDQNGTYMCWWDSSTIRNYSHTVEGCYNGLFKPVNKTEINTFRKEVVTSMAAVGLAYKGFRLFMRKFEEEFEHSSLKNLDLTQNQLFFISFAMTWCESVPTQLRNIINLVTSQPDPQYRVEIALAHFDKFGKYFACNDNLAMYQDKKCSII